MSNIAVLGKYRESQKTLYYSDLNPRFNFLTQKNSVYKPISYNWVKWKTTSEKVDGTRKKDPESSAIGESISQGIEISNFLSSPGSAKEAHAVGGHGSPAHVQKVYK